MKRYKNLAGKYAVRMIRVCGMARRYGIVRVCGIVRGME
jgi:hypothetical protein